MSVTDDNWLSTETFDFNVTASPEAGLGNDENLLDNPTDNVEEDDEEVFFGQQTFKEKVAATLVKEKEALGTPTIEALKPEEQALILRESALLSMMLKHGTPNNSTNKPSPIAVVHPMKRGEGLREELKEHNKVINIGMDEKNKNNINIVNKENTNPNNTCKEEIKDISLKKKNEQISYVKASKILQPRFSAKPRSASNPEATTKLPMPKSRSKLHSDLSEPIVDHVSLYGLSTDAGKVVRRRSGLPSKQVLSESSSSNKPAIPAMLPSAVPLTRMKIPSSSTAVGSKLKPMKATGISSSSTVPKSQLKLAGPRKSTIASQGTPSKSGRIPSVNSSLRRQNSFGRKPSTPGCNTAANNNPQSSRRASSLVTPVQRTPSSRKSITGRQLMGAQREKSSRTPSPVEAEIPSASSTEVDTGCTAVPHVSDVKGTSPNQEESEPIASSSITSAPSHSDIMNRYKKLKAMQATTAVATPSVNQSVVESERTAVTSNVVSSTFMLCENIVSAIDNKSSEVITKGTIESPMVIAQPLDTSCAILQEPLIASSYDSPLLKLSPMKVSPVKGKDFFIDPFQTGQTPPPLIDIGDLLEPEKPAENNLIEF